MHDHQKTIHEYTKIESGIFKRMRLNKVMRFNYYNYNLNSLFTEYNNDTKLQNKSELCEKPKKFKRRHNKTKYHNKDEQKS
ncbi:hypothetical protein H8356DRAFT_1337924 [Neocallimastix lanati (nom. inval.)]|nr:hypothetical protein H8356DRAFT_1337924 [Neocallimastix sp. JGI-2020a]